MKIDLFPGDYWPPLLELISGPLGHLSTVTAHPIDADPFELDFVPDSLQVTFSEDWAPYAQVDVSVPADGDGEALGLLDPRKNCRLSVSAGYVYPDGHKDLLPLADVALRERPVVRPADLVNLKAASDEARAQDYRLMWNGAFPRTGINEAVAWLLGFALAPAVPVIRSDYGARALAAGLDEIEAAIGDDVWAVLDDVAARTGVRIWCDETNVWRISARPESAGYTSLELTVGTEGTIITSESGLSRETWYNAAVLAYRWTDAANVEHIRYGRAQSMTGPYSVPEVGAKVYHEEITRPVSQAAANRAAESRLRNLLTRGRSLSLTAGAAYWVRPGMTAKVTLPTGEPEKHLVQSVTFRPHLGLMDLVTRQPHNTTITNGE